jgi:hypothetical protein
MDRWTPEQIIRMQKGGNEKAKTYFDSKFKTKVSIPEKVVRFPYERLMVV